MHLLINVLTFYFTGIVVSVFLIKIINAKERHRFNCFPPLFCLLSWVTVFLCSLYAIEYSIKSPNGKIAKFFNYTDKE